jgi:hypothetical protein
LDFVLADVGDWHYDTTVYVSHLRGWGDQPKLLEIVVPENAPLRDLTGAVSAQLGEVAHFETEIIGGTQGYAFNAQVQDRITGQLIASIPISINNNYIYQAEAIDPDGDRLSYSGTVTGPKTMDGDGETVDVTIDQDTGLVDWLPLTVGEYDFVLRVEDGRGGSDELSYVLAVTLPTNSPPEFVSDPISVAKVGSYSYTVEAIDPDGDELTYSLVEPNDNSIVLADKTLSWSPSVFDRTDNGSSEPKHVVVQVSDGVDSQLQEFDLEVLQENRPPVFASLPIEDHVVATPLAVVPPLNPVTVNPESISLSYLNPVSSSEYVLVENIDPSVNANLPQGTLGQLQVHPLTGTDVANWQAIADTLNLGGGSGIELVNEAGNQLLSPRNYSPSISHSAATELIPDVAVASGQDVTFSFSLTDDDSEFRYKVSTATLGNAVGPVGIQLTNPDGSDGVFNIDERAALNGGGEFHVHLPFDTANDNQHHMVVVEALDSFGVMSRQYVIITIGTPALEKPLIDERFESANSTQTTAGIYVNDSEMLGLSRYGIVLSTGDVSRTGSVDPLPDWGSGDFRSPALQDWALGQNQNGLLSTITGTDSHFDVTQFDMNFKLAAGKTHLYFDVVFASSEQAEEVLAADGFGIFLDGVDVTTQSISLLDASIGSLHPNMVAVENVPQSSVLSPDGKVQSDGDYSISVALEVSDGTDPDMVHFLQFVIGDSLDGQWDSTVYISNLSSADEENQRFTLVSDNAEFEVDVDSGEDDGFYTIETGGIAQFIVDIPFDRATVFL